VRIRPTLLVAAALALVQAVGQAAADPIAIERTGPYIHRGSGFVFPDGTGKFRRTSIIEYDPEATDVSAGYDRTIPDGAVVATIYVYPAPVAEAGDPASRRRQEDGFCREHFEGIKDSISKRYRPVMLTEEGAVASPFPGHRRPGLRAAFTFEEDFRGKRRPLRSEARLFCYVGGPWLIAYRFSAPADHDLGPDIEALTAALRWPDQGS